MNDPNPFGLIHELAALESKIRRLVQEARAEVHNAAAWLDDPAATIGPAERDQLVAMLCRAESALEQLSH